MAKRKIITIDEDLCNGCGQCVPNCKEGALQIVNGKAKLVSDIYCDGLGACLGHCPLDAIKIVEREAKDFDEEKVKEHLMDKQKPASQCGCPGAAMIDFSKNEMIENVETGERQSQLKQWPVQLHLVPSNAPYFQGKDVVLSADCVAYSYADFHKDFLKGKSLAIACPKLDEGQDIYVEKISQMIDNAKINTLTVVIMEVPCCRGLLQIAQQGLAKAKRKIPIKKVIVGLQGKVLSEEWA